MLFRSGNDDFKLWHKGTFSIALRPDGTNSEGTWTFDVTVTDKAGRETKLGTITTLVDTMLPELDENALLVNKATYSYEDANDHTWYKSTSIPFSGKYLETGSGIDHIEYTITQADSSATITGKLGTVVVKDADGKVTGETFSANLGEFTSKMNGTEALYNTVTFVAVDKAGNKSAAKELKIYLDTESPELTCANAATETTNGNKDIIATGTYDDDSSGVKSVTLEVTYTEGDEKKTFNFGTDRKSVV